MHHTPFMACAMTALLAASAIAQQAPSGPTTQQKPSAAQTQPLSDDEKAIHQVAEAFVAAYNAQDAKALANLFLANGEIIGKNGLSQQGRKTIEAVFVRVFAMQPKAKIQVNTEKLRLLDATLAMENGSSIVTDPSGEQIEHNRYTVVYLKQEGKWWMAIARDLPNEAASAAEEIRQLDWMVGEWVDEAAGVRVTTTYRWDEPQRCLLGEFRIQIANQPAASGTQRIAWDPLNKTLRSWVFDSDGGFAEGVWTRSGNQWITKLTGVTSQGEPTSSTTITTRVGKDRATWRSRDRVLGGKMIPDSETIAIVRKPPQPAISSNNVSRDVAGEAR